MKQTIRLRESELRKMIAETVKRVLNEDSYSYNGLEQNKKNQEMARQLYMQQEGEKNFKKNMKLFLRAYKKLRREYSIVSQMIRKSPEARNYFSFQNFETFVKNTEKNTLQTPIWEEYGGEYEEVADQFLQHGIIKFK